jgi:GT2 family glycosyltransferase
MGRPGRKSAQYVIGSVLLLRFEAIVDVGPFDEQFFLYFEETDWCYRAHLLGWRHELVAEVLAVHAGGGTSRDETMRMLQFHASQERYLRKHFGEVGWQFARLGQVLGDTFRAVIRPGEERRNAWKRASLYRHGPMKTLSSMRLAPSASDAGRSGMKGGGHEPN